MSADAKVWYDGEDGQWHGICDGTDEVAADEELWRVLKQVRKMYGYTLWWYPRAYPDNKAGLVGYTVPRQGF